MAKKAAVPAAKKSGVKKKARAVTKAAGKAEEKADS